MNIYGCICNVEGGGMDMTYIEAASEEEAKATYREYLKNKNLKPNSYFSKDGFGVSQLSIIRKEDIDQLFL